MTDTTTETVEPDQDADSHGQVDGPEQPDPGQEGYAEQDRRLRNKGDMGQGSFEQSTQGEGSEAEKAPEPKR